jgi:hypothetical protein
MRQDEDVSEKDPSVGLVELLEEPNRANRYTARTFSRNSWNNSEGYNCSSIFKAGNILDA